MAELVSINEERSRRAGQEQLQLIERLKDLLARAESGQLRVLCYAGIEGDDNDITLGILRSRKCGIHELVGITQLLSDRVMEVARAE
jgi:hypothetical protein